MQSSSNPHGQPFSYVKAVLLGAFFGAMAPFAILTLIVMLVIRSPCTECGLLLAVLVGPIGGAFVFAGALFGTVVGFVAHLIGRQVSGARKVRYWIIGGLIGGLLIISIAIVLLLIPPAYTIETRARQYIESPEISVTPGSYPERALSRGGVIPGDSLVDRAAQLHAMEGDALPYFSGCPSAKVVDSWVLPGHDLEEIWVMDGCGRIIYMQVFFSPSKDGKGIDFCCAQQVPPVRRPAP